MEKQEEKPFYGLVYDVNQDEFREDTAEGMDGILSVGRQIAYLSGSDEQSYSSSVETVSQALDVLEEYDYQLIEVSQENHSLFLEHVANNTTYNNRLSYEMKESFLAKANDFHFSPVSKERFE